MNIVISLIDRGNKKSVLILPSRKDFYLLECLLDYIGASFIPVLLLFLSSRSVSMLPFVVCMSYMILSMYVKDLLWFRGVTTHEGVVVIDFFDIMAFEMSKDLRRYAFLSHIK